jgi:lysozyme family protein
MTAQNFDACFVSTETWEGWHKYSNDPRDPGGATWCGLTENSYDAWRKKQGLPLQFVRLASDKEITQIFREEYWNGARCDDCPDGVDLQQFDIAINMGPRQANLFLQRALLVSADGVFGLETLGALQKVSIPWVERLLIQKIASNRLSFWEGLRTWRVFGKGWRARGKDIEAKALAMVKG